MKLLIDIGNTRLKWALARGESISGHGSVLTNSVTPRMPLEMKNTLSSAKAFEVWISSVGSDKVLEMVAEAWFNSEVAVRVTVVETSSNANGIINGYADIESLGVDRWVALIGARFLHPSGHLIVVDAGTAVTVDWLDSDNTFQGGAILPGPKLMHDALVDSTAGIESQFRGTTQIVGKDTAECVNSGVSYGLVGAVENVINEMKKVINQPSEVLLTGGASAALADHLAILNKHCADLVLVGLLAISLQKGSGS